jgi:uncharacterized protein
MKPTYQTDLYSRIHAEITKIKIVDCHEHLQRETELPKGDDIHVGRFFRQYASSDIVSAGMPVDEMEKARSSANITPKDRWQMIEPWYRKTWNTAYCECLRIALQDIYGIADFSIDTVDELTSKMQKIIKHGFTREIFDKSGIDFAMNNPFGPKHIFNPDFEKESFICDMIDHFTMLPIKEISEEAELDISSLDDYLKVIDCYFEKFAKFASAFKVGRAYDRILNWEDVSKKDAEKSFSRLLTSPKTITPDERKQIEDLIMHYLCKKCGEYQLRMKFHTGLQEGNGNNITNSRAALLINLFSKYPDTHFDMYHISYPYQEELACIAKNFSNVTIDFCWMWIINPAAGRQALSNMLDTVPATKIHGFGGDFVFVEGTYGHAVMARREITRVLCEKIEEGRFSEEYALEVADLLLRENPIENFTLGDKRNRQLSGHPANTKKL